MIKITQLKYNDTINEIYPDVNTKAINSLPQRKKNSILEVVGKLIILVDYTLQFGLNYENKSKIEFYYIYMIELKYDILYRALKWSSSNLQNLQTMNLINSLKYNIENIIIEN